MDDLYEMPHGQGQTSASHVAPVEPLASKLLGDVDPVWLAAVLICLIVVATRRLTSSNVERERPIAGGHYKGEVTPGWMQRFQKQEAMREEGNRTDLQEAIRARRR